MIYFDFASTTPLCPKAGDMYLKIATEYFGNASSLHDIGGQSAAILENCRNELATLLGVNKNGLYFTSGGSEANFLAIEALLSSPKRVGNHIITGIAEHSSIHGAMNRLKKKGWEITYLPFNQSGLIDLDMLKDSIKQETVLITIQHVNSEIGTIQPIEDIARICALNNIHFHSDLVQSFGKIDLKNIASLVSSFSFSGHKIYGPKGIGGVYINPSIFWAPFLPGSTHEKGLRPGTVNIPAIAAMTVAAQNVHNQIPIHFKQFQLLRETMINTLNPIKDYIKIHQARESSQLSSIIGLSISGIEGQWLMLECNRAGFAISTGSACQVGMASPSKAMEAIGITGKEAKEFIRISFGRSTKIEDVQKLGQNLRSIVDHFKTSSTYSLT